VFVGLITVGVSHLKPADPTVERASVVIDTVKRGSLLRQVRGYGKLVPEEMQWVPAVTQGRIERILARPGVQVEPDTVLLEMDNPELERDAATARMEVKAAEADYTSLRIRLEKEVLDQKAALAMVQSEYSKALLEAKLNEELATEGLISDRQLQLSKTTAEELTTRLEIERKRLEISSEAVEAQLVAQTARIDQLHAIAQLRERQLDSLHVRASSSGVLALLPVEVGQQVNPGTNLARIANAERLKAEIKIPETQVRDITIGQSASVDTHNGVIEGRVVRIDPTVQEGSVTVDIALEGDLPPGARPDLSVDGTIELERMEDILYVGRPAFGQEKSKVGLYKLDPQNGRASRIQVQLGRTSVNAVEIVEGLSSGDQVIVSDMSTWDSFDHIRLN
jgi:HlyD family secretion protein